MTDHVDRGGALPLFMAPESCFVSGKSRCHRALMHAFAHLDAPYRESPLPLPPLHHPLVPSTMFLQTTF